MTRNPSEKIIRNTVFNAAGRFWGILVTLFLTPYILGHVGIERFGVWAIVGIVTGYFSLLDFGMGASFVRHISECNARGDGEGISGVVSTGAAFYLAFGAAVAAVAFPATGPLLSAFSVPPGLRGEVAFIFRLGMTLFAASNVFSAFGALQGGLQRMDVTNRISVLASFPLVLGTIFALEAGYGLRGLMLNNAVILALTSAANVAAGYRLFPGLKLSPALVTPAMLKKLLGFGCKLQSAKIADAVSFQADRLLLAHFLGLGAAGVYQLGSSVAGQLRGLPLLLVSAVLPAASDLDARLEREKLRELYLRGSKYLALIGVPLFFFSAASARLLMLAWVGPGYEGSAAVFQVLAAGYLANLLAGAGTSVAAAVGKPELQMKAAILSSASNVALGLALVLPWGFLGVAAAVSVSLLLGPAYFFSRFNRLLALPSWRALWDAVRLPLAGAVPPALAIALLHSRPVYPATGWGRPVTLGVLFIEGLAFLLFYFAVISRGGYLDAYDREIMGRAAAMLRPRAGGGAC